MAHLLGTPNNSPDSYSSLGRRVLMQVIDSVPSPPPGTPSSPAVRAWTSVANTLVHWSETKASSSRSIDAVTKHIEQGDRAGAMEAMRSLATNAGAHGDPMALMHLVMKDSIQETNEDKKYWLGKLEQMNGMAGALSDYLNGVAAGDGAGSRVGLLQALDKGQELLQSLATVAQDNESDGDDSGDGSRRP